MKSTFFLFMIAALLLTSCKKDEVEMETCTVTPYYLDQWEGDYEGISNYKHGTFDMGSTEYTRSVSVEVQKSTVDSCLNFTITYDDTIVETWNDILFSSSGIHASQSGGGSSYQSLDIHFASDSLHYDFYQMCGIGCTFISDFVIGRK